MCSFSCACVFAQPDPRGYRRAVFRLAFGFGAFGVIGWMNVINSDSAMRTVSPILHAFNLPVLIHSYTVRRVKDV